MKSVNQKGFTIVELLVVIVVIGILAAITMVSYSGVTTKAKTTAAKSNASSVRSVIETYYADNAANAGNGSWPTDYTYVNTYSSSATALVKLPSGVTLAAGGVGATGLAILSATNGENTITYRPLATAANGGCIAYFDFTTAHLGFFFVGSATAATEGSNTDLGKIATCS